MATRGLESYRPQHDENCASVACVRCHKSLETCHCYHGFDCPEPDTPCSCGLDALIAVCLDARPGRQEEQEKTSGGVSPTAVDAGPCLVPAGQLPHDGSSDTCPTCGTVLGGPYDESKETDQARERDGVTVLHHSGALDPSVQPAPGESSGEGRTTRASVYGMPPMGRSDGEGLILGCESDGSEHRFNFNADLCDCGIVLEPARLIRSLYDDLRVANAEIASLRKELEWASRVKPPFRYVPLNPCEKLPDPDYGL